MLILETTYQDREQIKTAVQKFQACQFVLDQSDGSNVYSADGRTGYHTKDWTARDYGHKSYRKYKYPLSKQFTGPTLKHCIYPNSKTKISDSNNPNRKFSGIMNNDKSGNFATFEIFDKSTGSLVAKIFYQYYYKHINYD